MSVIKPSLLASFGLGSHVCRDASTSLHALWTLRPNHQEYKANLRHRKTIPKYRIKCKWNLIKLESRHLQGYFFLGGWYKVRTWTEFTSKLIQAVRRVQFHANSEPSHLDALMGGSLSPLSNPSTMACHSPVLWGADFSCCISLFWSSASLSNWFFYFLLPFLSVLVSLLGTSENSSFLLTD